MTLPDTERFRLLGGPYTAPRCVVGGWLTCKRRGRVSVVGMSNGVIQWPLVIPAHGGGSPSLALCGDLVKAVRRESNIVLCHWFGVTAQTVSAWRKALGVDMTTAGTRKLRAKQWTDGGVGEASRPARMASLSSPERAAKICVARGGRPFTKEDDDHLGMMTDREAAELLGRNRETVRTRRRKLGVPSFCPPGRSPNPRPITNLRQLVKPLPLAPAPKKGEG